MTIRPRHSGGAMRPGNRFGLPEGAMRPANRFGLPEGAMRPANRFGLQRSLARACTSCRHALGMTVALAFAACAPSQEQAPPKQTMVMGIDVSGSFRSRHYDDAIDFAAYYIYGHLNGLGGLRKPTAVFVGSIGGEKAGEVKAYHPIHDFTGKSIPQIAADLKAWFPPTDELTDFNAFFGRVASLVKRQNLVLAPLDIVVLTDGIPDVTLVGRDTLTRFQRLDLSPLEYLSRNTTVRVLYPTPTVAVGWEQGPKRRRVRIWTQPNEVMVGWRKQLAAGQPPEEQDGLWKWVGDNVDFRVRARVL